jgi:hypothetical protein
MSDSVIWVFFICGILWYLGWGLIILADKMRSAWVWYDWELLEVLGSFLLVASSGIMGSTGVYLWLNTYIM